MTRQFEYMSELTIAHLLEDAQHLYGAERRKAYDDVLNKLGRDGWEVTSSGDGYFAKREISENERR